MRKGKIQKYKKVLKYVKNTSSQESTREEKNVFKKIKHPLHKNEKIEAGFSLYLDKICECLSGKRYYYEFNYSIWSKMFRQYNGFQKKHDKDSVAGKQGSREDSI